MTTNSEKLPEWRNTLNKAVENYQSVQSWYEENQDSLSAEQDVDAAAGEIEKLIKQCGVLIVVNLLDEIGELQERRKADSEPVKPIWAATKYPVSRPVPRANLIVWDETGKFVGYGSSVDTRDSGVAIQMRDGRRFDSNHDLRWQYALQPAPVVPETLPCPVFLEPGLKFGKGVRTQCMLYALNRRADYYAELEAMTPEQRAEHAAGIAEFKAMLPPPAPVVPDELPEPIAGNAHNIGYWQGWNACRKAILAATPKQETD